MPAGASKFRKPNRQLNKARASRPTKRLFSKNVRADSDTVLTPAGPFPISKVHFVPPGARIKHTKDAVQIIGKDGKIIHSSPIFKPIDSRITATATVSTCDAVQTGWDAYTYWDNDYSNPEISYFSTTWTVPDAPSNDDGQLLYIFNGLQNSYAILQPVLQYGVSPAGGGSYWAIASWYVSNDEVYYSFLVSVSSGTSLTGIMTMTDMEDDDDDETTYYDWNCKFSGYDDTSLNVEDIDDELYEATETLETYNCTSTSDLPSGSTAMQSIYLLTGDYYPSLSWGTVDDAADGISVTVAVDGSDDGEVDINY